MSSPVLPRLCQVFDDFDIPLAEYRKKYGPQHRDMYSLLETQGLMERQSHLVEMQGEDGLPVLIELPFRERDVTIYITPPNNGRHRVLVKCDCGKSVPFGRLFQHKCKG